MGKRYQCHTKMAAYEKPNYCFESFEDEAKDEKQSGPSTWGKLEEKKKNKNVI